MDKQKDETIIKQGPIRHKDTTIRLTLERWKPRTAVLKSLQAGRLQFVLLDNKGVEKYQVPIEDYAGICINSKPDGNEKYSFALITERVTDVFAFETEEVMKSWGNVIQEKLGRVVIVNVTIPYRQHQLKQGLAMMILRDNAVAITTKDQPPKLQCSFLIRHIKHYGDFDDGFVFETGNKCPKGEKTYLIRCTDNKKLYNLLDGLANRSITIRDIILKQTFSEIAICQGARPKAPILPNSPPPSFNFGSLSSQLQLRQNKHDKRRRQLSTSDMLEQSRPSHRSLIASKSASTSSYYNVESGQENYQNLGPDGQSIVPEVEYEIIPDDSPDDVLVEVRGIKPRRGSVPVHARDSKYRNYRTDANKSATMGSLLVQKKSQDDSEYINVETPVSLSEEGNYVNTNPVAQESTGDSYVNFKPLSHQRATHSHDSSTEYVNVGTPNEDTVSQKVPTTSSPVNVHNVGKSMNTGNITSVEQEETDGEATIGHDSRKPLNVAEKAYSLDLPDSTPSFLPPNISEETKTTDVDYENFAPLRAPSAVNTPQTSEYIQLATVSIGQAKGHKEFVSIKPLPSTTDNPLTSEKTVCHPHTEPASGYEDFAPIKAPPSSTDTPENIGQDPQTEPASGYEDFVPIKNPPPSSADTPEVATVSFDQYPQTEPASGYEDFVPIKNPPPSSADTPEVATVSVDQYPQTEPASGYEDFVPIKNPPPSSADTPEVATVSFDQYPQTEPASGYEDFVPIKNSSSSADTEPSSDCVVTMSDSQQALEQQQIEATEDTTRTDNAERHFIEGKNNGDYSHLRFKGKESYTVSEQNDSIHPSTVNSNSDSLYSKLDMSEVSKTRVYNNIFSLKDKPQVPSRNLKRPIKLYEPSSSFTAVIPPLPPRNRSVQSDSLDSPSPPPLPPAESKPITSPSAPPPVGPKPGTRNSHSPSADVKYCDLEFTDIGQPKFRPRSKVVDQMIPSQNAYAIIDRDASVGLQITLEQKLHDRR